MVRENWHIYEIPELWRRRKEAGLCPACGKEKSQFAKGRKVYCSTECADIVAEKFQTWASLRDSIIEENPVCSVCGITREKFKKFKCPHLQEIPSGPTKCSIYDRRPTFCFLFPGTPADIEKMPRCGYKFVED